MFSARDLSERIPKLDAEGGSKDDDHDSVNQGQHKRRAADNDGKHGNPNEQVSDSFGHRFSVFRVPDYIELLPGSTGRVIHSEGNQTLVAFGTVLDEEVQTALLEMQSRARIPDYGKSRSSTRFDRRHSKLLPHRYHEGFLFRFGFRHGFSCFALSMLFSTSFGSVCSSRSASSANGMSSPSLGSSFFPDGFMLSAPCMAGDLRCTKTRRSCGRPLSCRAD